MPKSTTLKSGLVITQINDQLMEWQHPPTGEQARGQIRQRRESADLWSTTGLKTLRSGNWIIANKPQTLERAIEQIEHHIAGEKRTIDQANQELRENEEQRKQEEKEAQLQEEALEEYKTKLFGPEAET